MSDVKKAVALVFRRRGGRLTATDFKHAASFDLKWFPPREAQRLLDAALAARLVLDEGGELKPTFDVAAVDVPLDFRPGPDLFEGALRAVPPVAAPPPAAPLPAPAPAPERPLVERLAEAAGVPLETMEAAAATERERAAGLLGDETSLLLAARRRGVDVRSLV